VLGKSALPDSKVDTPTLNEYFTRFQETYLETAAVRDSIRRNYRSTFNNHVLPALKPKLPAVATPLRFAPWSRAGTEKHCFGPRVGVHLISRPVRPQCRYGSVFGGR